MVSAVAMGCFGVLFVCAALSVIRLLRGPSLADRYIAADNVIMNLIGMVVLHAIYVRTDVYFDLVLVFSLLAFVGAVCFAKFLSRGKIIE